MISVASYLKGIPPKNNNPEKPAILKNFIAGVKACGDEGFLINDYNLKDVDVAVVQGYVHPGSKNVQHLNLRKEVFEKQKRNNKRSIIIDANLFLYADPGNKKGYLRYSYDGIFPNTGEYCNENPDPARWEKISRDLGIRLRPWHKKGKHILICCQRDGGWSMDGIKLLPWLVELIINLRKHTDRKIIVRFHPGDRNTPKHKQALSKANLPNVFISNSASILQDFKDAHAVVNYNSSPAVAAAIEGVPIIVLDRVRSQAGDISENDISKIESLPEFDRDLWIHKIAQMHWNSEEVKNGTAWRHLRQWAKK